MRIYHGTSAEHVEAILQEGIKPRALTGQSPVVGQHTSSYAVYLTTAFPFMFAFFAGDETGKRTVFEIETDALNQNLLCPDEHVLAYIGDADWQESLSFADLCAYRGVIPPTAITRYVSLDIATRDELALFLGAGFSMNTDIRLYHHFRHVNRDILAWMFGDIETLPISETYVGEFARGLTASLSLETQNRGGIAVREIPLAERKRLQDEYQIRTYDNTVTDPASKPYQHSAKNSSPAVTKES